MINESYMMFGPVDRKLDTLDQTFTTGRARYIEKHGRPVTEAMVNAGVVDSLKPVDGVVFIPSVVVPPTEVWLIGRVPGAVPEVVVEVEPLPDELVEAILPAADTEV